jgi:hypothetical protein
MHDPVRAHELRMSDHQELVRFSADPRVDVIARLAEHTRVTSKTEVLSDTARRSARGKAGGRGWRKLVSAENPSSESSVTRR